MPDLTANAQKLYNQYRFGRFGYGQKREAFEPLLFDLLTTTSPDTVLFDIGCGAGYWLDVYLRSGINKDRIRCVDLAPANVEELQAKGFNASVGNAMNLLFEANVSDVTVCIGVINVCADPFKAFTELVRITRPGGTIYLNVYNKLHPYYYVVHRATFPIRYCYWNWSKKIVDVVYYASKPIFQPLAKIALGAYLDDATGKTMFMDQVITPYVHLFSKSSVSAYARRCGCTVERFAYNRYGLMLSAIMRVH